MSSQGASYGNGTLEPDYYAILGVPRNASAEEIKTRYKELVLKFHPDREGSALAAEAMVWINRAYEILSDPQSRQEYDHGPEVVPEEKQQEEAATEHSTGPAPGKKPYIIVDVMGRKAHSIVLAAMAAACLAGLLVGLPGTEGGTVAHQYIDSSKDIFTNEIHEGLVSLPLLIPGFGVAWGFLALFTTGLVDRAVFAAAPGIHGSVAGNLLPYTLLATGLKILACYIGMCRSVLLVQSIRRRRFHALERSHTEVDIILVMFLYGLAALVEVIMAINA